MDKKSEIMETLQSLESTLKRLEETQSILQETQRINQETRGIIHQKNNRYRLILLPVCALIISLLALITVLICP